LIWVWSFEAQAQVNWYLTFSGSSGSPINNIMSISASGKEKGYVLPSHLKLRELRGMAIGADGGFYVTNSFEKDSKILKFEDPLNPSFVADIITPDVSEGLIHPYGITFSPKGYLYVSNQDSNVVSNYEIRGPQAQPGSLSPFLETSYSRGSFYPGTFVPALSAMPGAPPFTPIPSTEGGLTFQGRHSVRGIAFGPKGKLYVADEAQNRIAIYDNKGNIVGELTHPHLEAPAQVIFNLEDGQVYVGSTKTHRIFQYNPQEKIFEVFANDATYLKDVSGLAFDGEGNLYAASRTNRTLSIFDENGKFQKGFASHVKFEDDLEMILPVFPSLILAKGENQKITSPTTFGYVNLSSPSASLSVEKEGSLTILGSGFMKLTQGNLRIDGATKGFSLLMEGGNLEGSGNVHLWSSLSNTGGTFQPNHLTLSGDYEQGPQGIFEVNLEQSSEPLLTVNGDVSLDGKLLLVSPTPSLEPQNLKIMSVQEGTITGQFATSLIQNSQGTYLLNSTNNLLNGEVHYDQNQVTVALSRKPYNSLGARGPVPQALDRALQKGASPTFHPLIESLDLLPISEAKDALDQLHTSHSSHLAGIVGQSYSLVNDQVQNHLLNVRQNRRGHRTMLNDCFSEAQKNQRITSGKSSAWMQTSGQAWRQSHTHRGVGLRAQSVGTSLGVDSEVDEGIYLGILGGYTANKAHFQKHRGQGDVKNYYAGLYGMVLNGPIYLDGNVILGRDNYHQKRHIHSLHHSLKAHHHGFSVSTWWEVGYGIDVGCLTLTPFGQAGYENIRESKYGEKGTVARLKVKGHTSQFIRTQLGFHLDQTFKWGNVVIQPDITLAWLYKGAIGHSGIRQGFAENPTASFFKTRGEAKNRNQFAPSISTVVEFENHLFLAADIGAEVGGGERLIEGFLRVGVRF